MKKVILSVGIGLMGQMTFAQLNGNYNIPGSYPTLAAAIADLNTQGVSGSVVFNIQAGYTETAPVGGYTITATGTAANNITIQALGGATIMAYSGTSTPGSASQDGVFHIIGGDYITFNGITIVDPNTTNPSTMEYGFGFFKANANNGSQYNTIQNCKIFLSYNNNAAGSGPSFEGSKGIMFINAQFGSATTALIVGSQSGAHSYNTINTNTISNVNYGIAIVGYAAPSPYSHADVGNTITNNLIKNFGGATSATRPAAGIRVQNQLSLNIINNVFINNDGTGSNHPNTLRGIYIQGSVIPSSMNIDGNIFSIISGATTSQISIIQNEAASGTTGQVSISNNLIQSSGYTTAGTSGTFYGIYNLAGTGTLTVNNNTITAVNSSASGGVNMIYIDGTSGLINIQNNQIVNHTLTTTGSCYAIYNDNNTPNSNVTNNIINNISKGNGGTFYGYYNFGSPSGGNSLISQNQISNITLAGGAFEGIRHQTSTSQTVSVSSNTISAVNIASGTGYAYSIRFGYYGAGSGINNNLVQNINNRGVNYGVYVETTPGPSLNVYANSIYSLSTTGIACYGYHQSVGNATHIYGNRIGDLSSSNSNPTVYGIYIAGGTTNNIYNNIIGNLFAPNANASNPVNGIYIGGGGQSNIYYNTVRLSATSTGSNFGSSAIFAATTPTVLLQNNIFINNSTPTGTGVAVAYRRSSTSLTTYNTTSNKNIFYAGTPSPSTAIFTDGTNTYSTLTQYKAAVSPADIGSYTENTQFLSLTSSNTNFLHVDGSVLSLSESNALSVSTISVDIDGDIRQGFPGYAGTGLSPDIGADEYNGIFAGYPDDVGVNAITAPPSSGCYSANENVIVSIKNYGTNNQSNIPVTVWVSGPTPATISTTYTNTINSGATATTTVGTINMTASGTYTIKAFTGLSGDQDNTNDTTIIIRTVAPTFPIPQQVDFTGYNGSNLSTVFSGWYEAQGSTPTGTISFWTNQTGVGTATNVTARINLYTNTRREWIIGPKIVPTNSTVLKFDAAVTDWNSISTSAVMGSDDAVYVMISTDCGLSFTPIYTINASNNLPPTLTPFIVPLTSYSNTPIIIGFYATDGTMNDIEDYDFHLDNINIENASSDDIANNAITSPNATSNCLGNENVIVNVSNNGVNPATNFTITAILTGPNNATISTTYTNTLNPFASTTINVGTFNMSLGGNYTITTFITYPPDVNNSNDTVSLTYNNIQLTYPFLETFDAVSPLPGLPLGWKSDNGSAFEDFTVRTTGAGIQHGAGNPPTKGICANLYSSNPSSYFETPAIGPLPAQDVELRFVYRIVNFLGYANPGGTATPYTNSDSIKVLVSSNCGNTWNMLGFINGANHTPSNTFALKAFCLGQAYSGQSIKIRIEAKWSSGDYWIDIDSLSLNVPTPVSISPSNNVSVCENVSLVLSASGATSYTWLPSSTSSNTLNVSTTTSGTSIYTLNVTYLSGCSASQQVTVNINPNPTVNISVSGNPICANNTATLTANTNANSYTWTPSGTTTQTIVVTPTTNTTYTVGVTDANGCQNFAVTTITVNPAPTINTIVVTAATSPSCNNGSATVTVTGGTSPYTYAWSSSTSTTNVATGLNGTSGSGTSYTVTVTGANGCSTSQSFTVTCVTGITSMVNTGIISVYPNPNNGEFKVSFENSQTRQIKIMDVTGRVLYQTSSVEKEISFNINEYARGSYILEIQSNNGVARFNIVKE